MALEFIQVLSEKASRENPSAKVRYRCAWGERWFIAQAFCGGLLYGTGSPIYTPPLSYSANPGLKVQDIDITWCGDFPDVGEHAWLDISYGLEKQQNNSGKPQDLAEISVTLSAEGIVLPKTSYSWTSGPKDGQALTDEDVNINKFLPFIEVGFKFKYKPKLGLSTAADLVSKVNQDSFQVTPDDVFDPGTVVYLGLGGNQSITSDGGDQWSKDHKFAIRMDGWNKLFCADSGQFETVDPPLYEDGDLDSLFDS